MVIMIVLLPPIMASPIGAAMASEDMVSVDIASPPMASDDMASCAKVGLDRAAIRAMAETIVVVWRG